MDIDEKQIEMPSKKLDIEAWSTLHKSSDKDRDYNWKDLYPGSG